MTADRKELSAREFVALVREKKETELRGVRVVGGVDLSGESIAHRLRLLDVVFDGAVDLSGARFERGLDLSGSSLRDGIDLRDARFEGPLILNRVTIGSEPASTEDRGSAGSPAAAAKRLADLTNIRVMGRLSLVSARVFGDLACGHAEIEDDLQLDGARIDGDLVLRLCRLGELSTVSTKRGSAAGGDAGTIDRPPFDLAGELDLSCARIAGDVRLVGAVIGGELVLQAARIEGNLICRTIDGNVAELRDGAWLMGARITGTADFTAAKIVGSLLLENASVGGSLHLRASNDLEQDRPCTIEDAWLLGTEVGGSIDVSGAHIGRSLLLQNARIGQNLQATNRGGFCTVIEGEINLNAVRVRGTAEFRGVTVGGQMEMGSCAIDGELYVGWDFDTADPWKIVRSKIGESIRAESATIGKRVLLLGVTVGGTGSTKARRPSGSPDGSDRHCVSFSGARIHGDLLLRSDTQGAEILRTLKDSGREPEAERRECLLADARRERTEIGGDLRLARAEVLGDVVLGGARVAGALDLRDARLHANLCCQAVDLGDAGPATASADDAVLEAVEVHGDADLTGLEVARDLLLGYSRIHGCLTLAPAQEEAAGAAEPHAAGEGGAGAEPPGRGAAGSLASIGGDLRLDAATISEVVMSGSNLRTNSAPRDDRTGAEPAEPVRCVLERATIGRLELVKPLPGKLDLDNLRVGSWEEHNHPHLFERLLDNSEPFRKRSYLAIENDLRNQGRDRDADKIHQRMRRRERRLKPWWRKAVDLVFLDLPIAYGTESWRLFALMLVLFVTSVLVFKDPAHVEYDLTRFSPQPPDDARWTLVTRQHPEPENWNLADAALLAVRLHVPIVTFGIDEEVRPSGSWKVRAYTVVVVAFSWVAWPLFLASVSGLLRKRN